MPNYRVNATLRNKAGREIGHRTPLWAGNVPTVRDAQLVSYGKLEDVVSQTSELDSITLHIIDERGNKTTATEYADDFRGAYGSSADATGLLTDQMASMPPDQLEAAKEKLAQDALRAMPTVVDQIIFREDLTGQKDGPTVTVPADPVKGFFDGMPRRPNPPDTGAAAYPRAPGKGFFGGLAQALDADVLDILRQAQIDLHQATGRRAKSVVVSSAVFEALKKQLKIFGPCDKLTVEGIEIIVNHTDPNMAPITMELEPRVPFGLKAISEYFLWRSNENSPYLSAT